MKRLAVLILALTLGGAACKPSVPDSLIWARSDDSGTLDPAEIEWGEDAKVSQNIFEPLVTFRTDSSELEGRLAKSWAFSDGGRTLTFQLREGVKFHDGTTFDAEDVVFTFQRLIDDKHPNRPKAVPYGPNFAAIASVKADGPSKAVFTLREPSGVILYILSLFGAGIVSPEAVKKHGEQWATNPVGTGPYKLARWDRKVKIVLERFDGYWGAKPPVSKVVIVPVQSPQTAIQRLKQGEVHVVDHPTLADIKPLLSDAATHVDTETSLNVCYLGFNLRKAPYDDLNFRRAVSLALDRKSLNELAYYGLAEPSSNIVPPAIWRNLAPTPEYEHDIEKAKEALKLVKLESNKVELIHMTYARPYVPEPARVAEWVKDQLRKIGLEVKLTGFDKAAYTQKTKEPSHPMYLLGWNADYPHPDNFFYPLLHGDNAGDLNGSFFNDPEFNESVKKAQSEPDPDRQKALYTKAYARYRHQLPTVPLVHARQVIALAKKVSYNMHPIEYRFYDAEFNE